MFRSLLLFTPCIVLLETVSAEVTSPDIKALREIKAEGQGNAEATAAWQKITQGPTDQLMAVVGAVDGASPVAANWLRTASAALIDKALQAKQTVPTQELTAFIADRTHAAASRVLAFDLLKQANADAAEKLVPTFATDPVQTLRRPATAQLIAAAQAAKTTEAWRTALTAARDEDQIKTIAEALKTLGQPPDLPTHFGFLRDWQIIAPFDNTGGVGFAKPYPPEESLKLDAAYPGKSGEVKWQPISSTHEYGKVDLNKPFGLIKEVVGYAQTQFHSTEDRPAEIRLGCKNGWKVWLNGKLLFGRDEYHRGAELDQYKMPCQLKKGANDILIKLCQDGQTQEWTVEWEFQLRVCDEAGTAILSAKP